MTIKDIARLSGYGVGTVSRVLNHHPDVSDAARERVMAVVRQYGFEPNSNARHLKSQTLSSVTVLVKGTQNMPFADRPERVQSLLLDSGDAVPVADLPAHADEVTYAIQLCRLRRPKGLIFLGGDLELFRSRFDQITVPSVLLTNNAAQLGFANLSSFTTDDSAAAACVVDYLVSRGHTRIGLLGGNLSSEQISYRRIHGACEAMQRHGLTLPLETQYEPCRFSLPDGYAAAKRLLQRQPDLTAIFCMGDVIASGAMRAVRDLGLRVPEDVSLIGYDGILWARYSVPRLTTVRQNTEQLAARGVSTLLKSLHYDIAPVHEIIPFQLLEQESVLALNGPHLPQKG